MSFIWLACHNRLPTKALLAQRHIIQDDICPLCKAAPETIMHILCDCSKVQTIWARVSNIAPDFFAGTSTKTWIKTWSLSSLDTKVLAEIQWKEVFPILSWTIWSARNKAVMEGIEFNAQYIFHRAKSIAIEFHFSIPQVVDKPAKSVYSVRWHPPPLGFFKLNTDGTSLGNPGLASAGGLLRNSDGSWISGFIRNIGIASSFAAELWGVRDGLLLAQKHNIQNIIIELDAKAVIDLLSLDNHIDICSHPLSALITDCRSLIHSFEEAGLLHTHREGNFCADILAKEGSRTTSTYIELFSPPIIVSQLMADIWGVSFPRTCNI